MTLQQLTAAALTLAATASAVADLPDRGRGSGRLVDSAPAFDPVNGADPNRYPPQFPVDFSHLRLELQFDNLRDKSFKGVATFTLRAVRPELKLLKLNAVDLYIDGVTDGRGRPIRFDHDAVNLALHFDTALPTDADTTLVIRYRCVDPEEGMVFALPDAAYPDRPLVVHTQGETETSRYWFPCVDYPYDRLTTEMVVTVPQPFFALSNGRLIDTAPDPGAERVTYHWRQGVPHVNYLVTLVIGQFDVVKNTWRDRPVDVYVPKGRAADARRAYSRTPDMIEFFSTRLGVDYPYEKYAQVTVPLFRFGGMENTTATTLHDRALLDERAALDHDIDGLIAHELAHQWFGDLITCRSWPHVWLNEGFATFMDTVWTEEHDGREEYLYAFFTRFQSVSAADSTDTPGHLVWSRYTTSFEPFFHKGALAYSKGSSLLQMLRHQLGDDLFWQAMKTYTRRHRDTLVETDQLRHVFEEVSGRNLEQFFEQWAYRPGTPHLHITYNWHYKRHIAEVTITQTQKIDADTPAYDIPLDLYFRAGGETTKQTLHLSTKTDAYRRRFDVKPDMFCVDPNVGLLAKIDTDKPRPMWLTQLTDGPTNIARIVAARALVKHDRPEVVAALTTALNDRAAHWSIRAEAAASLGALRNPQAMHALLAAVHQLNPPFTRGDTGGSPNPLPSSAASSLQKAGQRGGVAPSPLNKGGQRGGVAPSPLNRGGQRGGVAPSPLNKGGQRGVPMRDPLRARRAVVEALGHYSDPRSVVTLIGIATSDISYAVEAAATAALGRIPRIADADLERRVIDTLIANTDKPSHEDEIRSAALNALADRQAVQGIPAARRYASYGHHPRSRPTAIAVLARLAQVAVPPDPRTSVRADARDFLIDLLDDPQERTVNAAIEALGRMPDPEARIAIERRLAGHTTAGIRRTAETVLDAIKASPPVSAPVDALRKNVKEFRRRLDDLGNRVKDVERAVPHPNP